MGFKNVLFNFNIFKRDDLIIPIEPNYKWDGISPPSAARTVVV